MTLHFFQNGFIKFMRLRWPAQKPGLQAFLAVDTNKKRKLTEAMTGFIMANTPPSYQVFFVAGSAHPFEHENMKQDLRTLGVQFSEKVMTLGETNVGSVKPHKKERTGQFVFGSTDRRDVIRAVFDCYHLAWYGEGWAFIFFVAQEEPTGWRDIIDVLSVGGAYSESQITSNRCILETRFEHGICIASFRITRDELEKIAAQVAEETSMYLTIKTALPPKKERELRYCEVCDAYRWFIRRNVSWYCNKCDHKLDEIFSQ